MSPVKRQEKERALAKELGVSASRVCIVGSTLICGEGNDEDYLCLVPSEEVVEKAGFAADVKQTYEPPLRSYRRGKQNIIATTDLPFFFAEVAIAHGARLVMQQEFDMSKREDRIRFHSEVRGQVLDRLFPLDLEF